MSAGKIYPIVMPKWGLSMSEGRVGDWIADTGQTVKIGDHLLDVETDKIAGTVEATAAGELRRIVAKPDEVLPVGALLGVLSEGEVAESDIDAFVAQFQSSFVPGSEEDAAAESPYRQLQVGPYALRYAEQGDGNEAVILVHGFGGDLDNWLFNQGDLAAQRTVYALDLPGHGQSVKTLGDGALTTLAQVLADFMDAVGVERAHLVGHSLGGAIIQQLAVMQPARVRSLALIASAGLGPEIDGGYIDGFISSTGRRDTKQVLERLFANQALVSRQMVDDILKYKRLDGVTAALRTLAGVVFAGGRQQTLFRDVLAGLGVPVLVVWGTEDRIIPAAHADGLPENVTVRVLPGYGHMVQMEAAKEVNALLQTHFAAAD